MERGGRHLSSDLPQKEPRARIPVLDGVFAECRESKIDRGEIRRGSGRARPAARHLDALNPLALDRDALQKMERFLRRFSCLVDP